MTHIGKLDVDKAGLDIAGKDITRNIQVKSRSIRDIRYGHKEAFLTT